MTSKAYVEVQAKLERWAPIWQERLGLSNYTIHHRFLDRQPDESVDDEFRTTAETYTRWQYFQARVLWYLPSAIRHSDEELERTLVHELVHVLLGAEQVLIDDRIDLVNADESRVGQASDSLTDRYYEHLEHATETVTLALLRAWAGRLLSDA